MTPAESIRAALAPVAAVFRANFDPTGPEFMALLDAQRELVKLSGGFTQQGRRIRGKFARPEDKREFTREYRIKQMMEAEG